MDHASTETTYVMEMKTVLAETMKDIENAV